MVARLTEQRRIINNRLRRVSDDIMQINATRPDLGGLYLSQLEPERVQLIRWHDSCSAALEEARDYTKEELSRTGRFGARRNRLIDASRPHTSPFSHSSDRFFRPVGELERKRRRRRRRRRRRKLIQQEEPTIILILTVLLTCFVFAHRSPSSYSSASYFVRPRLSDRASTPGPGKYSPPRWPDTRGISP